MSGYESKCLVCGQRITAAQVRMTKKIMAAAGWHPENIAAVGDRCLLHTEEFLDRCENAKSLRVERAVYGASRVEAAGQYDQPRER